MLLSRSEIDGLIGKGFLVSGFIDKKVQLQQCGIDLTVGKIFSLRGIGALDFTNEKRKLPEYEEIKPEKGAWALGKGTYHAAMNEKIRLPDNIAGLLLPRSSALSCGIEVHTAVWDPGYKGRSFMHLSVSRPVELHKNARIAQMIFFALSGKAEYKGSYKGEDILNKFRRGK
ncbi:MAG: deoxyuridine 5'-triphosphate nucleotidohydrolase [Candidatus Aenigmarchaeota archaeon]|nr:deoxyuridine 5'-triphosphate nucleotidohydrolase [Candidatus Aenigmarchaeota archaeon]